VEFGFSLPGRGPLATPETVLRMATTADALRYDSVFVTDHVVLPVSMARSVYPYAPTGQLAGGAAQDYLEPFALLGWLAHATKRIRLGTSVLVVPYRNPLVAAKMLATLDRLSRGRMILGAGVGWLREEFEALAAPPFEARGAVTDEYLRLMRLTWTTDPVRFEGTYYRVSAVHALPKPAQKAGIPIWIGGHTDAALKRAGTLGDGWHPIGLRPPALLYPDEYAAKAKQVHAWAQRAGRDPRAVTLTFRCPMDVRSKRQKAAAGDRPLFQGTAEEVAGDIRTYAALGVSHFVFDPTHQESEKVLANIERFADEVRPKAVRAETVPPTRRAVTSPRCFIETGLAPGRAGAASSLPRTGSAGGRGRSRPGCGRASP
jgi:probable F420-dependent oxidoreductase